MGFRKCHHCTLAEARTFSGFRDRVTITGCCSDATFFHYRPASKFSCTFGEAASEHRLRGATKVATPMAAAVTTPMALPVPLRRPVVVICFRTSCPGISPARSAQATLGPESGKELSVWKPRRPQAGTVVVQHLPVARVPCTHV